MPKRTEVKNAGGSVLHDHNPPKWVTFACRFTALSHEYNQPLAATRGYAENALVLLENGRTDEARDNIGRIAKMAERMAHISKHLRDFARKPDSKTSPVLVSRVLDNALAVFNMRLRDAGAEVRVGEFPDDLLVVAGYVQLEQVLVNLIGNALDAMTAMPDPRVEISVGVQFDRVDIRVRDHGSGIDAEVSEHMFDPFFTTKGPRDGLGLGLSISYNIVKDFRGDLCAANAPDGGAVLTVSLKRATLALEAAE